MFYIADEQFNVSYALLLGIVTFLEFIVTAYLNMVFLEIVIAPIR